MRTPQPFQPTFNRLGGGQKGRGRAEVNSLRRGSTTVFMSLQKAPPRRISPCPARRAPGGPPDGPPGGGAPLGLVPGVGQCPPRGPGTSAPRLKPPHIPRLGGSFSAPPGKAWESLGKPGKAWESPGKPGKASESLGKPGLSLAGDFWTPAAKVRKSRPVPRNNRRREIPAFREGLAARPSRPALPAWHPRDLCVRCGGARHPARGALSL